jgi:hypothetical protein
MKKELFIIIPLACFKILFSSYNVRPNNIIKQINLSQQQSDTVAKEIPIDGHGKPGLPYLLAKQKATQLGLDSLELGYDSLQIRIWFDYSLAKTKHLVIIKRSQGKWSCQLFTMQALYNASKNTETVLAKDKKNILPKSGWETFTKALFGLGITTLPNRTESGMDGVSYNVEVATKHLYRFYEYWSPETTENKSLESKNMVKIIELLENECSFKRSQK